MSRRAEIIMHLVLSVIVVVGFSALVVVGALSVVRDLLALTKHRPSSVLDELGEDLLKRKNTP
jgi:hypothetical protein